MQDMPFKVLHICILLFRFCIRATAQPEPDIYTGNAEEATNLWESAGCELQPTFTGALMPYLGHRSEDVRGAAAEALAAGLQVRPCSYQNLAGCNQGLLETQTIRTRKAATVEHLH